MALIRKETLLTSLKGVNFDQYLFFFINIRYLFPFTYKGTKYDTCITVEDNQPWCSTEVDSTGHYIGSEWGYCSAGCPKGISCHIL